MDCCRQIFILKAGNGPISAMELWIAALYGNSCEIFTSPFAGCFSDDKLLQIFALQGLLHGYLDKNT